MSIPNSAARLQLLLEMCMVWKTPEWKHGLARPSPKPATV